MEYSGMRAEPMLRKKFAGACHHWVNGSKTHVIAMCQVVVICRLLRNSDNLLSRTLLQQRAQF